MAPNKPSTSKPTTMNTTEMKDNESNYTLRRKQAETSYDIKYITEDKLISMQQEISDRITSMVKATIQELVTYELSNIYQQVTSIQESMTWFNQSFEDLKTSISVQNTTIETLKTDNIQLKSECTELKDQLHRLIEDNNNKDQWVRRSNIEIVGIPEKKDENLIDIVGTLSRVCGYNINPVTDIDFITRVAVKSDPGHKKPKPIIIKLQARYKKDEFLTALRKKRDLATSDIGFPCESKIYANDHLTSRNKYLLRRAKTLAREKNYTMCWVRNCSIMVRRKADAPIIYVNNEEDLKKIK